MIARRGLLAAGLAAPFLRPAAAFAATPFADDARTLIDLIFENYAYRERLAGFSERRLRALRNEADRVGSSDDLIVFGERAIAAIFDHHAIMSSALANSYGLVPSYADLWIELQDGGFAVTDVRTSSPSERAGVRPGDWLTAIEGERVEAAIARYIEAPIAELTPVQQAMCARMLAAGRRDRSRRLTFARGANRRELTLANLYAERIARPGVLTVSRTSGVGVVRINDSLGDGETITAFAGAVAQLRDAPAIIVDLRDTASGGNTQVARGIMGWFVDRPMPYQHHELSAESIESGVRRSWIEEVSPVQGAPYRGRVAVLVGRWTGSMGEGLAIGFDAIGADIVGSRMAGLLGGIYDLPLPNSRLSLKLPVERLNHVDGRPREDYVPPHLVAPADARDRAGHDAALAAAVALV